MPWLCPLRPILMSPKAKSGVKARVDIWVRVNVRLGVRVRVRFSIIELGLKLHLVLGLKF